MSLAQSTKKGAAMEYSELTDEVKARLKGCETPEELLALAREEGYELSDEELESVSGGGWGCNNCSNYCSSVNCECHGPSIE